MQALSSAIERVAQGIRWISQGREVHLLEVVASPVMREPLIDLARAMEHEQANRRPFIVLGAPLPSDDAWEALCDELLREHDAMRAAAREVGLELPDPRPGSDVRSAGGFAALLARIAGDLRARECEEPLVVWAPESAPRSEALPALESLVRELAAVRFALIVPEALLVVLGGELARAALRLDVRLEPSALAGTMPSKSDGCAAPGVEPPPTPPDFEEADEALAREGLPAHAVVASDGIAATEPTIFERIRRHVTSAMALQGSRQPVAAVAEIREARDLCFLHGRDEDGIRLELMLGGLVLAAGDPDAAVRVYATATTHAVEHERPILAAQSEMARGTVLRSLAHPAEAAEAFARAGRFAEDDGEVLVALDCYRSSGECALAAGLVPQAAEAWQRGVTIASKADEPIARTGSVVELAEELARLCEQHGLIEQARSLRAHARRLREETTTPDQRVMQTPPPVEPAAIAPPSPAVVVVSGAPKTAAFPEAPIPFVRAKDRLPAELKGTVRLGEEPDAPPTRDGEPPAKREMP